MNRLGYITPNSMKIISVYSLYRNILSVNFEEIYIGILLKIQKKGNHRNHPTPSASVFSYISFTSLCKSLCSLSLTSLYMSFYSGESSQLLIHLLFLFFVCFLFLSLHCALALFIIYLSFCFNEGLCQRSALLHLNTQHPTKRL